MGRKKLEKRVQEPFSLTSADEVFDSPKEMVDAIESLIRYLNKRYAKKESQKHLGVLGFIVETLKVEFSPDVEHVEISTNFAENSATIVAPQLAEIDLEDQRRVELLKFFFPTLKDAQLRATVQLYRTLRFDARDWLIREYSDSTNDEGVAAPLDATRVASNSSAESSGATILIIDDNEEIASLEAEILRNAGFVVVTAANGQEGLAYLCSHDLPALVILDLHMPEMNGYRFSEVKACDPRLAGLPVLICSSQELSLAEVEKLGAQGTLPKVLDPEMLIKSVRDMLRSKNP